MSDDWGEAFTAKGFNFTGCNQQNDAYCNCATWVEESCGICGEAIEDGQEIYMLTRTVYPWWPEDSPDQAWEHFFMHEVCPEVEGE